MDSAPQLPAALLEARDRRMGAMELLSAVGRLTAIGEGAGVAELYRTWLEHNADNPVAYAMYFNYAAILSQAGDQEGAKNALLEAVRINPDFLPPYINLGHSLERLGAVGEGVQQWYKVVEKLPQINGEGLNYKITALKQIGRVLEQYQIDENAEAALRMALEINPNQSDVTQHWVSLRQRQCKWPVIAPWGNVTKEHLLKGISSLSLAAHTDDPLMQLANAAHYCKTTIGRPERSYDAGHARLKAAAPGARRKIGYLSSDLREHAIGFLTAELYEVHDRNNVEVFLYYCGHKVSDVTHQRIKAAAEHWVDIGGMSDEQAAERIVADGIEVLVDVNGYTHSARIKLLAMRPAPIIVNWLGFPGSLGTPNHHYLIADEFIIPRESEIYYAEKVLRLPCYQPNDRKRVIAEHRPTRAEVGLPEGAFVFCCFNGVHKITPFTWARWMKIMHNVPGSVLWLLDSITSTSERLKQHAAQAGIDPSRIIFAKKAQNPKHLARYPLADLFLDTTPYGAHTTSSDALWMGVPVLTLAGRSFASRVCGSLLKSAGLPELICSTPERYMAMAVDLARNPEKLKAVRRKLADQRDTCVLFDTPLLARKLEGLYADMWADFMADRLPRPDLSNLDIYNDIGCALDDEKTELQCIPDYREVYRRKLAELHHYSYIRPDNRLWTDATAPARPFQAAPVPAPVPAPVTPPPATPPPVLVSFETTDSLLRDATAALAKGDLARGAALLERARGLDPANPSVLDLAARAALMQGRLDEAEALARKAVDLRPVVPTGLTLAEVMKAKGNLEGAAKFFTSVLATQPKEPRALIAMGDIHEQTGRRGEAAKAFESALNLDPANPALAVRFANVLPIAELGRGRAALERARPADTAPPALRLGYLNQLAPYKECAMRAARGLMPYHVTALSELYFDQARGERDAYEAVADLILTREPGHVEAAGAKAVALLSRGQRLASAPYFKILSDAKPDSIYGNIVFDPAAYEALEAMDDTIMTRALPPLIEVVPRTFQDEPIIYLSCNYAYFNDFGRPLLLSIDDVAASSPPTGAAVHLHVMDATVAEMDRVVSFCAGLKGARVAVSAERPGVDVLGLMPARCYYHAVRFVRLYQHLNHYKQPLWMMDVDALIHRDPRPMFAALAREDVAFRARPARWEPWNQFNASVMAVRPTPAGKGYLRLIAAFIAAAHARDDLHWGIDQLAMYQVHAYLKDQDRAPAVRLLDDRAVDYEYNEDGFVWCNSGTGKFSQLQQLAANAEASVDSQRFRYFEALKGYMSRLH
jgi:predicted O-linked N-acetylglucosamine transferase (SPINDLY family)